MSELNINRTSSAGGSPEILADIYQQQCSIAIWRRTMPATLTSIANELLMSDKSIKIVKGVTPQSALLDIHHELKGLDCATALSEDIAELVAMFCCLFDLKRAGLRITTLDYAMCPRFHVDKIPCRLVTTYSGVGSQWLPHQVVNRSKLGSGNQGLPDELFGLYQRATSIEQLACGEVALLKGDSWEGNENAGLVHRSPQLAPGEKRLLLTLDFL